jgi:hypothetical protein
MQLTCVALGFPARSTAYVSEARAGRSRGFDGICEYSGSGPILGTDANADDLARRVPGQGAGADV